MRSCTLFGQRHERVDGWLLSISHMMQSGLSVFTHGSDSRARIHSQWRDRGFMFWSIKFEGQAPANTSSPLYLAAVFNAILRVRPTRAKPTRSSPKDEHWGDNQPQSAHAVSEDADLPSVWNVIQ